jgi:hypothetical protein
LAKTHKNGFQQIGHPTHGKRKQAMTPHAAIPRRQVVPPSDICVQVLYDDQRQELSVGAILGSSVYGLTAGHADEISQSLVAWLGSCDCEHVDVRVENRTHSLDRQGAYNFALLLSEYATLVEVLSRLTAYKMETRKLDRADALREVMEFLEFARASFRSEALRLSA